MLALNVEKAIETTGRLRALGLRLSVDDFGTGYSSLNYLREFRLDQLKIDRSFINDLGRRDGSEAIVRATVSMGHSLGLNVIAEGVETPEQLNFLKEIGCDEAQGYLISRPVPAPQLAALVSRAPRHFGAAAD